MDPLATLAELETSTQRTVEEAAGLLALQSASGLVRDYVGWPISLTTETLTVDGSGTTLQSLPTMKLVSVAAVRVCGVLLSWSETGWTATGEYTWSERGQLYRSAGWPRAFRSVEVDCVHGYATIPDAIRAVVLGLAGATVFSPAGSSLESKTVGGVSHTYRQASGELTALQTFQLSGYRLN